MKPGSLVIKSGGDWDVGKIGCLIDVKDIGSGTLFVHVLVDGQIKIWSKVFVEELKIIDK